MKTKVIFRKWKDTGDVIAIFPEIPGTHDATTCLMYEHVGQHGAGDAWHVIASSVPASGQKYLDLIVELERIGYDLQICKRYRRHFVDTRKAALLSIGGAN